MIGAAGGRGGQVHSSEDEMRARQDFAERYAARPAPVVDDIERRVIGDSWGANGYTTRRQADLLAERLRLDPRTHLLDLGTGRGWPGLYLAKTTGCEVTLSDLPFEGLALATRRAREEQLRARGAVVASAARLPFTDGSFDAVVHTDVLC